MKIIALIIIFLAITYYINSFLKYKKTNSKKEENKRVNKAENKTKEIIKYEKQFFKEAKKEKKNGNHIKKGKAYEFFIGNYFKQEGYKIYYQGINKGFKDYGIDLIAYKKQEIMLIQCKNWNKWKIDERILNKFENDCNRYVEYNKRKIQRKTVKKVFVVANNNLTKNAIDTLHKPNNSIKFLHIPMHTEDLNQEH